jgi:hypothetical protein
MPGIDPLPDPIPATGTARVHILQDGYVREEDDGEHVESKITLIVDGDVVVVVDPGMVASREALLAALAALVLPRARLRALGGFALQGERRQSPRRHGQRRGCHYRGHDDCGRGREVGVQR